MMSWANYSQLLNIDISTEKRSKTHPPQGKDWVTDSRGILAGQWYAPLEGHNFNGHDFIGSALKQGAAGFLYSKKYRDNLSHEQKELGIEVNSVLKSIQDIAHFWRKKQSQLTLIALTGSVGKTTAKEMVSCILRPISPTLSTKGNFNNEIGVPKTLLNLSKTHQFAVVEMGARHPHDIGFLANIAVPDVACCLNAESAHLEIFGDRETLLRTKLEIYEGKSGSSMIICPRDDDRIYNHCRHLGRNMITFGKHPDADVIFGPTTWQENGSTTVRITIEEVVYKIEFNQGHESYAFNAAAAMAIGLSQGLQPESMAQALSKFEPLSGRYKIELRQGATFIDDSYNANPNSMIAGLSTFSKQHLGKKKVLVLGDMLELGSSAVEEHERIGTFCQTNLKDAHLITVGNLAINIGRQAVREGMEASKVRHFSSTRELLESKLNLCSLGNAIFLKGSNSIGLKSLLSAYKP